MPSLAEIPTEKSAVTRAPDELTLGEALELAVRYHRADQLDVAESVYRRVLEMVPEDPEALHFLGVLLHQRGKHDEALELLERAIVLQPERAGFHQNMGNVLFEMERLTEAARSYERCLELAPDDPAGYNNLGVVRRAQRQPDAAAEAYRKAIEIDPRHPDAYHNMGNLLTAQGRIKEAVTYLCTSMTLRPAHPESRRLLALAYANLGRLDEAVDVYRKWLEEEPGDSIARHMLAACGGDAVPERATDQFVQMVFDSFALSFDAKLEKLHYRAPQLIAAELARIRGTPEKSLVVLDAGCGTGLSAPLLAPFAARLIGVDLSAQMLAKARQRGGYDALLQSELTQYMRAHRAEFDLIVSSDTLCYFGALDAVLESARCALRGQGAVLFTVEQVEDALVPDAGYRLNPHGRYSHSEGYVRRALAAAHFEVLGITQAMLRMESGCPVAGLIVSSKTA
ncbi:MAG TPA: tetratricopeptide repeat protein, partial [Steroidobacteraceae bacterium]